MTRDGRGGYSSLASRPAVAISPPLPFLRVILGVLASTSLLFGLLVVGVIVIVASRGIGSTAAPMTESPSALALSDIPAEYLSLYEAAAARYGLDWSVLAGIGKVECDHGRDPDPSCTQEGATNSAGAGGPMQFLAATWARYGVSASGSGPPDRWNAADAIFGAANYLRASGAPADYNAAIFAYNHAGWYVAEVEHWAAVYRGAAATVTAAPSGVPLVAGSQAVLSPDDGHLALAPADAPPPVVAMIAAGNALQDLPYGPAGHPDPVGAPNEDCSSTVNYVLYRGGVRSLAEIVRDNPLAQSYVNWGLPGPGRWVTIYATTTPTDHVFVVIAGLRLDTSHNGTDVGPNRDQDGPRWRVLGYIPTWAPWSVRHPPGL